MDRYMYKYQNAYLYKNRLILKYCSPFSGESGEHQREENRGSVNNSHSSFRQKRKKGTQKWTHPYSALDAQTCSAKGVLQ